MTSTEHDLTATINPPPNPATRDAVATIREAVAVMASTGGHRGRLALAADRLERHECATDTRTLEVRIAAARASLAVVPEWGDLTRGQVLDVLDRLDDGCAPFDAACAIDPDLDLVETREKFRCVDAVADAGRIAAAVSTR